MYLVGRIFFLGSGTSMSLNKIINIGELYLKPPNSPVFPFLCGSRVGPDPLFWLYQDLDQYFCMTVYGLVGKLYERPLFRKSKRKINILFSDTCVDGIHLTKNVQKSTRAFAALCHPFLFIHQGKMCWQIKLRLGSRIRIQHFQRKDPDQDPTSHVSHFWEKCNMFFSWEESQKLWSRALLMTVCFNRLSLTLLD